jgi:hypothetical protein
MKTLLHMIPDPQMILVASHTRILSNAHNFEFGLRSDRALIIADPFRDSVLFRLGFFFPYVVILGISHVSSPSSDQIPS